jgi:Mg-chelatase subunit ChlD
MSCRKNFRDLTDEERRRFVRAVKTLKRDGVYDEFVRTHHLTAFEVDGTRNPVNWGHGGPAFLPWHREYLRRFELALQRVDSAVTLPYWDWTEDPVSGAAARRSPLFEGDPADPTDGLLATESGLVDGVRVGGPFGTNPGRLDPAGDDSNPVDAEPWLVRYENRATRLPDGSLSVELVDRVAAGLGGRALGREFSTDPGDALPTRSDVDGVLARTTFEPEFRSGLEVTLHNTGHRWVGGDMAALTSPNDPVFFLHHCFVDKLWADWQARHPTAEQFPPSTSGQPAGHKLGDPMQPWGRVVDANVLDHRAMRVGSDDPNQTAGNVGYTYDTDAPLVELVEPAGTPPTLSFRVPERETLALPVGFDVTGCGPVATLTASATGEFAIVSGFTGPEPTADGVTERRNVWVSATGAADAATASPATGTATVTHEETGEQWTVELVAETVDRPTVAVGLVLDKSGSMRRDAGDGTTRVAALEAAASLFVDVLGDDDAVGIVTFDTDATGRPDLELRAVDDGTSSTPGREAARTFLENYPTPGGETSIGDGLAKAQTLLLESPTAADYEERALVVFTDGHQNEPRSIDDALGELTAEKVFAVGLGTPGVVDPGELEKLVSGRADGYVQTTGLLPRDDEFRLRKLFLQILAGVTDAQVVTDPPARIREPDPGEVERTVRVPYRVTAADFGTDVVLLGPDAGVLDLRLEPPDGGAPIEVGTAASTDGLEYHTGDTVGYYRATLPVVVDGRTLHEGTWHAVVSLGEKEYANYLEGLAERVEEAEALVDELHEAEDEAALAAATRELSRLRRTLDATRSRGVPFSLSVHAESNLRLRASLAQRSYEPGATLTLRAALAESGVPLASRADVTATVERPDGTTSVVPLAEVEPGAFETTVPGPLPGVYSVTLAAEGTTLGGEAFTRERLLTGALWAGGDEPRPPLAPASGAGAGGGTGTGTTATGEPAESRERLCELLFCLLEGDSIRELLERQDVDVEELLECLERYCE